MNRFLDSLRSLEMTGGRLRSLEMTGEGRLGRNDRGRQLQWQADGMFRTGLCKRYTSRRRAKAVPEEHVSDAAAAAVLKRFLRALRLVEKIEGGALVEIIGQAGFKIKPMTLTELNDNSTKTLHK